MPDERTNLLGFSRDNNSYSRNRNNRGNNATFNHRLGIAAILLCCYILMIIISAVLKGYIEEWTYMTHANVNLSLIIVTSLLLSAGTIGILFSVVICDSERDIKRFKIPVFAIILTLQFAALVYGYLQINDGFLEKKIITDMREEFRYPEMFNKFQYEKDCCGVLGVKDYIESHIDVPSSCCSDKNIIVPVCSDIKLAYPVGCASKLYHNIIMYIAILTYIETALFMLQVLLGYFYYVRPSWCDYF